ncbi:MAG: glycosyltransferase, partial [Bacteroidia bacterium]
NEGTPVSLIEAQAAGRFIVTTNVGGIKDILHEGAGLLSEPGDSGQYKINLLQAVTNFDTLNKNAVDTQKAILEKFSYKRLCKDMDQLYRELLKKK